jgi:hypothetical protein
MHSTVLGKIYTDAMNARHAFSPIFLTLRNVCVGVFLGWFLLLNDPFSLQLAPLEIRPPLPESAEIQEQHGLLCLGFKAFSLLLCKVKPART